MPAIVLFVGTIVGALVLGRAFCGSICPLGTIQEWLYNGFGKIIPASLRKKVQIPAVADKVLRYGKYVFLVLIIAFTWVKGDLVFRSFDPWATYGHIFGDWAELIEEFLLGLIILVLIVLSTAFVSRAWCKYLCPFGGFLGILAKFSWFKIKRNSTTCINCKACNRNCPMDIDVANASTVTSAECIECGSCVSVCPVPATLDRKAGIPPVKMTAVVVPILAAALFGGTYGIAKATGVWRSVSDIRSFQDIKGSNSIIQIARSANVSVKKLLETAGLPVEIEKDADQMIKTFKTEEYRTKYNLPDGFETDVLREAFAKLTGQNFVPEGGSHASEGEEATKNNSAPETSAAMPSASGKKLVWGTDVKGSTTLNEFLKLTGKTKEEFIAKFSLPEKVGSDLTLKDLRDQYSADMEEMKAFFGIASDH
jgi:ferredoxin